MKNEIIANSCRVCLTKNKKLRSLYKPIDEGDEPPNEMLQLITGIQVEKMDEYVTLPKNICKNCELSLSMAFEFRVNALKTQQIIVTYLKELNESLCFEQRHLNTDKNVKKEYEEVMDLEPLNSIDALDEDLTECSLQILNNDEHKSLEGSQELFEESNAENETIVQETIQRETEFYKEREEQSYLLGEHEENENKAYSDHLQGNDETQDYDVQQKTSGDREDDFIEDESEEEGKKIIALDNHKVYTKAHNSKVNTKKAPKIYLEVENVKQIPRRGRKPINSSSQIGYICDVCGNVFAKRGRMMEHRQRHDKELKYSCELCNEKFHMRELLRKHMFSHSGGKPLKCEYCSRTFYYESVRKAHEAVHQGHKPYVCDVCGKAFGYAHALKKHKLIHAEIKLYRCEYCNKDFRLQHHMKQHELTRLHKNAVRIANGGSISAEDCNGESNSNGIITGDQAINEDILFIEEITDDQLANGS